MTVHTSTPDKMKNKSLVYSLTMVGLLFLASCSPAQPKKIGPNITADTLAEAFDKIDSFGLSGIADYHNLHRADLEWVSGTLTLQWKSFRRYVAKYYSVSGTDCDDQVRGFCFLAQQLDPGVAIGEFWYKRAQGDGHSVCSVLSSVGGVDTVLFYEPQLDRFVTLTPDEIKSSHFRRQ